MEETMKKFNVLFFVTVTIVFSCEARSQEYTPDTNTVALYHFNETSGSIISDASGNNRTAIGKAMVDGKFRKARSFDSVDNNHVQVREASTLDLQTLPAVISSFVPTSGPIGTEVTIIGTNFNTTMANNIVYFGAVKANLTNASSTHLTVIVPISATFAPITVTDITTHLTAYSDKPFSVTFPSNGVIDANSFAPKVDITTGSQPEELVIADIDSDGKPDLATGNADTRNSSLSVFRNVCSTGEINSNSFVAGVSLFANAPYGITSADIEGDGKLDLIAVNTDSRVISVYRNISTVGDINTSSFASRVDFPVPVNCRNIVVCDLDGDGKPDFVTAQASGDSISVLRNTSTVSSVSFASAISFKTASDPEWIAAGDLDGDGKPDLLVANSVLGAFAKPHKN
jgi:hypothetical protein